MANVQKWVAGAGQGLTWGAVAGGTPLTSLANGSFGLFSTAITNGTALDLYADFSVSLGSITSGAGTPYVAIYLMPLNQDGTTYADGTGTGSVVPGSTYFVGAISVVASATAVITGTLRGVVLPPGSFK